jgi:hypothetical protein
VIAPHVKKVVIANPKQVHIIAYAKIKTDTIDASVLAQLYASGFLPEVWIPDEPTQALRRQGDPAQPDRPAAIALEEHHPVDPAQPLDSLPAKSSSHLIEKRPLVRRVISCVSSVRAATTLRKRSIRSFGAVGGT